jgi:site-specific recombinase XerD
VKDVVPSTCKRAGLAKRITTHGLRHTFASHLAMRGQSRHAALDRLAHDAHQLAITRDGYRTRATRKRAAEKRTGTDIRTE